MDTAGGAYTFGMLSSCLRLLERLGEGWSFLPVFRDRNAKGAFACGAQSDRLPGDPVGSDSALNRMAELWGGFKGAPSAGPTAPEILEAAAEGRIQTLFLHRCDDLVTHVHRELIEEALARTPNVIVTDAFPSWITDRATIVLPGAHFFETEGSLTAADGALQSLTQGNPPPGEAQEDWRLIAALLGELDPEISYPRVQDVFREWLLCLKPPMVFTLADLRLEGPGTESPQRPQSAIRKRTRPDFKLHFTDRAPGRKVVLKKSPAEDEALRLAWFMSVQGADHLGSRSAEFDALRPAAVIELNPRDALGLGIREGDTVRVSSCSVEASAVRLNPTLPEGLAWGAANVLGLSLTARRKGLPSIELTRIRPNPTEEG
jgi:predicted molibdopterin-dependent oxidoreductase YjgC